MKVVSYYDGTSVRVTGQINGWGGATVLDLVAHFLGIAAHHNDNAAPCVRAVPDICGVADTDIS